MLCFLFMQSYHAETTVNNEGKIILSLPFPIGEKVDVLVKPIDPKDDDAAWKELAAREFLKGYSEEDSIYDSYNA